MGDQARSLDGNEWPEEVVDATRRLGIKIVITVPLH